MDFVPMIILLGIIVVIALAVIIYPRKDTFVDKVKFKSKFLEFEISAKQKNDPPEK